MGSFQERDIFNNLEEITPNNEQEPISSVGFLHETESGTILEIASEESLEKYLRKKGHKFSKGDKKTTEDLHIIMHRLRQDPLRNGIYKLGSKGLKIYGVHYDL